MLTFVLENTRWRILYNFHCITYKVGFHITCIKHTCIFFLFIPRLLFFDCDLMDCNLQFEIVKSSILILNYCSSGPDNNHSYCVFWVFYEVVFWLFVWLLAFLSGFNVLTGVNLHPPNLNKPSHTLPLIQAKA